ncbi:MAG: hypothetical protein K9N01_10940 [Cephaloticoccus sp.]|nr:hypothetical protein [Cephaloticoccus sp.]
MENYHRRDMSLPDRPCTPKRFTYIFWGAVVLLISTYALVSALWARPMIWADSAAGFRIWDSMQSGGPWNCYTEPDPENIAFDRNVFRTWWSPGQFLPAGLLSLTGLSLGASINIVTLLGVITGLAGCWKLFKTCGFSEPAIMISVAIIALGWHTSVLFGMFNGGELALFAGFPWIAWAVMWLAVRPIWLFLAIPPLFLLGTFLKLSFPLVALSLCAGLWLGCVLKPVLRAGRIWQLAIGLTVAFVAYYCVLWILFLSRGPSPGDPGQVAYTWPLVFGFSCTGPMMAIGAFDSLIARAVFFPGSALLSGWEQLGWILCALAGPAIVLYLIAYKSAPTSQYRGMLMGFVVSYIVLFTWLYLRGASVSTDDRHFRPAAIILIPGVVQVFLNTQAAWLRRVLAGIALLAATYGLAGFINRAHYIVSLDNTGLRGFTQNNLSPAATAILKKLGHFSSDPTNFIVYVTSPEIALEFPQARIIQTHAESEPPERLRFRHYEGRVNNLLIVTSLGMKPAQTTAILLSFQSYDPSQWFFRESGGSGFYYQGDGLNSVLQGQPITVSNP